MLGSVLSDRYEILESIGEGGMATVYRALDRRLNREVALKVLHAHLARNNEFKQRFAQEASIAARLEHPNIVKIYDFGVENADECVFIVFELVRGKNLHHLSEEYKAINGAPFPPVVGAMIVAEVLRGLQVAHKQSCVHRDVKPDNVLVTSEGEVKLTDFGIAKHHATNITVAGKFLGSPSYSSPEQVQGQPVDGRSDLYAAGIILYELLTGQLPFEGHNVQDVMLKIAQGKYRAVREVSPLLPVEFDRIIDLAMRAQPMQRYPHADSFIVELQRVLELYKIEDCRAGLESFFKNPDAFLKKHTYQKAAARVPTVENVRTPDVPLMVNRSVAAGGGGPRITRQTNLGLKAAIKPVADEAAAKVKLNLNNDTPQQKQRVAGPSANLPPAQPQQPRVIVYRSHASNQNRSGMGFGVVVLGIVAAVAIFAMWMMSSAQKKNTQPDKPAVVAPTTQVQPNKPAARQQNNDKPDKPTPPKPQISKRIDTPAPAPQRRPVKPNTPTQARAPEPEQRAPVVAPVVKAEPSAAPAPTQAPRPETGRIAITTIPGGAPVVIDGKFVGESGRQGSTSMFEVKPGTHSIQIRSFEASGVHYEGFERNVFVDAGKTKSLGIVRLLPYRTLTIQSSGPGVIVKVNGDPYQPNGRILVLKLLEGRINIDAWAQNGRVFKRQIDLRGDDYNLSIALD